MKKIKITTIIIAILVIASTFLYPTCVLAKGELKPDNFKPTNPDATAVKQITDIANPIIGTIKTVGVVIAVVTLAVLGAKYMTGSISEKADYKKTMIPYLIGAVLVVGITQFLGVLIEIVTKIK